MKDEEKNKILVAWSSGQMEIMEKRLKNVERAVLFQGITFIIGIVGLIAVGLILYGTFHDNQYWSRITFGIEAIARHFA